jgi:putative transposase
MNVKRTYRLHCLENLIVRRRKSKRKLVSGARVAPQAQLQINERWSMDFVSNVLSNGRRIRMLTVVDCFSRESLAIHVDRALPSRTVTQVLELVIAHRGAPAMITTDNGPEFTSRHFDEWAYGKKIQLDYIRPGKPTENATSRASTASCATNVWTRAGSAR